MNLKYTSHHLILRIRGIQIKVNKKQGKRLSEEARDNIQGRHLKVKVRRSLNLKQHKKTVAFLN